VSTWETVHNRWLRALHLNTMSGKFLLFTVLATLFTTLVMVVALPTRQSPSAGDRVDLELQSASSDVARELGVWIDQRVFDLRLRASPIVVSDNLARATGRSGAQAVGRLRDYLNSIRQNLPGHEGLAIVGLDGQVVANSGSRTGFRLSQDQLNNLRTRDALVGDATWDAAIGKEVIVVVAPIRRDDGQLLGALSGKINLNGVIDMLQDHAGGGGRDVSVITEQGRLVIRASGTSADLMKTTVPAATFRELIEHEGQPVVQSRPQGGEVLAVLRRVPQLRWAAVAEAPPTTAAAAGESHGLRTSLIVLGLLIVVAVLAMTASTLVTRPLVRLSEAAARAAAGELSAELPPGGSGEVGYLTRAFSTLVARLREREGQSELERLSLTDALTGLYNRRHLMGTLASEVQRSRRLRRSFTVLLADVYQFKQYNDTHGHLAGDTALVKIAEVFRQTTRAVDCVARYGGEEFVVMLLECSLSTAAIVAERVRARVAQQELGAGRLTVSIGLAEYPEGGDTPEDLIATADAAMYRAKGAGRNQVVVARVNERRSEARTEAPKPRKKKPA
jgi:diguanylate cyclase (GGDEF)-like protein